MIEGEGLNMAMNIFYFVVFPGFVFTALVGLLATWVDRKVSARVQWRQGPPWYQPFMDILKLLGKETLVPENASKLIFLGAPIVGLAAVIIIATILGLAVINPKAAFVGDLIVVLCLLTIPSIARIFGGLASRHLFSVIGSTREMKLLFAYELPFLFSVLTIVTKAGSNTLCGIVSYQSSHGMFIFSLSGIIAFMVALLAVQATLSFVPFDTAEAEQEIEAGPLVEYSGTPLAVFRLTKAILLWVLPLFLIILFMGGMEFFSWTGILWLVVKYVIILTVIILLKNTNPRLRIDQAVRLFWGPIMLLAITGLILAIKGL